MVTPGGGGIKIALFQICCDKVNIGAGAADADARCRQAALKGKQMTDSLWREETIRFEGSARRRT